MDERLLGVHDRLRYAAGANNVDIEIDGYLNYHYITSPIELGLKKMILESGINQVANVDSQGGTRRPVIALRSSPWKAGGKSNPWHDEFDLDHGYIRYFGDHKVTTAGLPGATSGNRALLEAWQLHAGTTQQARIEAPPILVFRAVSVRVGNRQVHQGYVEFCGAAVIERLEHVVQRDPTTGRSFPNIAVDLAVIEADEGDSIDMRWIDDRRRADLDSETALRHAPKSWLKWVKEGRSAIPRIRRRVLSSRVRSKEDQMPPFGSEEDATLQEIYRYFDGRKHSFEILAARVAAEVLKRSGARYHPGWLTRSGGDGGVDFIGRLDVGTTSANTPVVVLGQAKCISPSSSISPDQVARVVARLRRGWIGVFVTTGSFSNQAQVEVIDDQYPLILVPGRELVEEVQRMAASDFDGDLHKLLDSIVNDYEGAITARRPEEVLWA
jgi:hypothetical protein